MRALNVIPPRPRGATLRLAAAAAGACAAAAGATWALAGAGGRSAGLGVLIFGSWFVIVSFALPRSAGPRPVAAVLFLGLAAVAACQSLSGAAPALFVPLYAALAATAAWSGGCLPVAGRADSRATASAVPRLALVDAATGAGTTAAFEQRAAAELARARRHDFNFGVVRIEIGGLGAVRADGKERLAEDVLRGMAVGVAGSLRGEDFVARLGGDSFAVLLAAATPEGAQRVVDRVKGGIDGVRDLDPSLANLSASFGLAVYPRDGASLDVLLGYADAAAQIGALRG